MLTLSVGFSTYVVQEELSPPLFCPWLLIDGLHLDQKLSLEVDEFVEIGKELEDKVLREEVSLEEGLGVFLYTNEPGATAKGDRERTCITSRSPTYFRSVSTSSRRTLVFALPPKADGGGASIASDARESVEPCEGSIGGVGGSSSKSSGGNWSTMAVTVLTT